MKYSTDSIKSYVKRYFSDDLLNDKTIAGDMERQQLRKWLLTWAKDYPGDALVKQGHIIQDCTGLKDKNGKEIY